MEHKDYLDRLADVGEQEDLGHSFYSWIVGGRDTDIDKCKLKNLLFTDKLALAPGAAKNLAVLEGGEFATESWRTFKWRVKAFVDLCDGIGIPILDRWSEAAILEEPYFYFESMKVLREAVVCGLSGYLLAMDNLLRLFIEFSVFQNYFLRTARTARSHHILHQYLATGRSPNWNTALNGALPPGAFCRPIKYRTNAHYRALSERANHPYHPGNNEGRDYILPRAESMEALCSWNGVSLVLDAAIWIYCANIPALLFPKNALLKFGYNPPVGMFVDDATAHSVRIALGEVNYGRFREFASRNEDWQSAMQWYESLPTLSDAEIDDSWHVEADGPLPDERIDAHGMFVAALRAKREAMARKSGRQRFSAHNDEIAGEELTESMGDYEFWSRLNKKKG